jgi:hypothetical protein
MTSPSPLERLAGPGNVLAKEAPDAKEFAGLVRSRLSRSKDARIKPTRWTADSISPTALLTHSAWRRFAIMDSAHRNGTSCFKFCRPHLARLNVS